MNGSCVPTNQLKLTLTKLGDFQPILALIYYPQLWIKERKIQPIISKKKGSKRYLRNTSFCDYKPTIFDVTKDKHYGR